MTSHLPVTPDRSLPARLPDERRRNLRIPTARLVRVAHDGCTSYARCRDISDNGIKLSLLEPIEPGERVEIGFSSRVTLPGQVAWVVGAECGIVFDREIDCVALLTNTALEARSESDRRREQRRKSRGLPTAPTVQAFRPGLRVTMMLESGREEPAVLDWAMDKVAGLTLEQRIDGQPVIIEG